jgi:hypothetical protein
MNALFIIALIVLVVVISRLIIGKPTEHNQYPQAKPMGKMSPYKRETSYPIINPHAVQAIEWRVAHTYQRGSDLPPKLYGLAIMNKAVHVKKRLEK